MNINYTDRILVTYTIEGNETIRQTFRQALIEKGFQEEPDQSTLSKSLTMEAAKVILLKLRLDHKLGNETTITLYSYNHKENI